MSDVVAIQTGILPEKSSKSAVSWGAIAAGGILSAAFTLFLVELVAGLGLVMVSPWSKPGASASTLSVAGGIGLVLMAVMASALGGFIAGRLRTRWVGSRPTRSTSVIPRTASSPGRSVRSSWRRCSPRRPARC